MSVFGGDSWAREAQHRKRRIDDLMVHLHDTKGSTPSYKQLSNGKYSCLVCPNNPLLDTPLMLCMHVKGSRHIAAESRLEEKELSKLEEINKRIALSGDSAGVASSRPSGQHFHLSSKPLIEQTRKAAFETCNQIPDLNVTKGCPKSRGNASCPGFVQQFTSNWNTEPPLIAISETCDYNETSGKLEMGADGKMSAEQQVELCKHREKELKFTSAGWKRDCHGKWYRDENVEFDSDEEDPNVCLS